MLAVVGWLASEVREEQPLGTLSAAYGKIVGFDWLHWANNAVAEWRSAVHCCSVPQRALVQERLVYKVRRSNSYWLEQLR